MSDAATSDYREHYRQTEIPAWYRGYAHLATTVTLSLLAIVAALAALDAVTPLEWLTVPVMIFVANIVEYWGHRGPMHHPLPGLRIIHRRHALQHHRFFTDEHMQFDENRDFIAVLFPIVLVVFYLGLIAAPLALVLAWTFSANVAFLAVTVAVAYFLNYELLHFAYHAPRDSRIARLPLVNTLRRLHLNHHRPELMTAYNFNITYPIGDWLFGTRYR